MLQNEITEWHEKGNTITFCDTPPSPSEVKIINTLVFSPVLSSGLPQLPLACFG